MSWEREPLWTKARLFFERAFDEPRDSPVFGLWCALGLELLARALVASVSPTLLAEPDADQRHLLYALGRGAERGSRKSISAAVAFGLCRTLFPKFTEEDFKFSLALVNRRNEELHTGAAAFENYPARQWLVGFYSACKALCEGMGESLETLFEQSEAAAAAEALTARSNDVMQRVNSNIAAYKKVFAGKPKAEQDQLSTAATDLAEKLAFERHHRVTCPSCNATATLQGHPVGREIVQHDNDDIVILRSISPDKFACNACGLALDGYAELHAAGLGGHYTRRTRMSPEDYYGLVNLDSVDMGQLVGEYLDSHPDYFQEYDNE